VTRFAPLLLAFALEAVQLAAPYSAISQTALLPVRPTAPLDGATIETKSSALDVKLAWDAPREPIPVHFFVEVVAVDQGGQHEVFARYVDQSYAVATLASTSAEYAWRVYTVGSDEPVYAIGEWHRFSVLAAK
jgi:hypothetical protein